jgi:EmrB/QacA subfamily drug resistance transporter
MDAVDQQAERTSDDPTPERLNPMSAGNADSRPLAVLLPALAVVLVAALDLTVIAPILPRMLLDLRVNTAEADRYVWVVSGYLVAYTITIPLLGRVSDIFGRRNAFLIALAIFMVGSFLCASAHSLTALITARTIQGLGGGAMLPISMALVGDIFPAERRAGALGIVAAVDTLGWVLGPIWGAGFAHVFGSWRDVFWLNLPIGAVAALFLMRSWRGPLASKHERQSLDLPGAALLSVGLLCLNLGVSAGSDTTGPSGQRAFGATPNPLSSYQVPLIVVGVLALIALIFVELRARNPLIPLTLFRDRLFSSANATNGLVGAALMVGMVNVPLQVALIATPERGEIVSAELLGAFCAAMATGGVVGGQLTRRLGYRTVVLVGLLLAGAGFLLMTQWPNDLHVLSMARDLAIGGFGFGLVIAPVGAAALNAARARDLGIASGLVIATRLLGMTIGISALTGWAVSRLNRALVSLPPLPQKTGESLADYLIRQQNYATNQAIPLTLSIIRDTFAVAAVLCLLALIPALLLGRHESK